MAKVTAYLCEDTGSLFLKEEEYKKHRRAFIADKKKREKRIAECEELKSYFKEIRLNIKSANELTKFINKNYYTLLDKAINLSGYGGFSLNDSIKLLKAYKLDPESSVFKINIAFERPDYTVRTQIFSFDKGNSHHCPEGGVTNWGGQHKDAPRGYPGARWDFRVKYREDAKLDPTAGVRTVLKALRLHPGSGGSYYGDMEVFSADWPFQTKEQLSYAFAVRSNTLLHEIKPLALGLYPGLDFDGLKSVIELQDLNFKDSLDFISVALQNHDSQKLSNAIGLLSTVKTGDDSFKQTVEEMLKNKSIKEQSLPDFDLGL